MFVRKAEPPAILAFPPVRDALRSDGMLDSAFDLVELRRYAMRPGCRDTLIALFERAFIETQEAAGMVPVGHYRDLDDPNSYVWFRAFPQRARRHDALHEFYTSPTWLEHRNDANATLLDSDNVLLLRDARPGTGFDLDGLTRPNGAPTATDSLVVVFLYMLDGLPGEALLRAFETAVVSVVRTHAQRVAAFITDEHPNAAKGNGRPSPPASSPTQTHSPLACARSRPSAFRPNSKGAS